MIRSVEPINGDRGRGRAFKLVHPRLSIYVRLPIGSERLPRCSHVHKQGPVLGRTRSVGHRTAFRGVGAVVFYFFHGDSL